MLKQHSFFIRQTIAVVDCGLLVASFACAHLLVVGSVSLNSIYQYILILIGFMGFYLYFAWTRSLFSILQFNWLKGLEKRVVMIFASACILGAAILYILPHELNTSRRLYVFFVLISFILIFTEKCTLKFLIIRIRRKNRNITPIILFGRGRIAAQVNKEINSHPEWGLRIVSKLDLDVSLENFETILKNCYVEEIFFCIPRSMTREGFRIDPYLQICEEMGRSARVFINLSHATVFARWQFHDFMSYPTLISHTVELDPDQLVFKRIFDLVGSIVGMTVFLILYPVLAILIKAASPGPVFFKQVRVGKNGKRFIIYKFRSMYLDAEQRKKELEKYNELNGAVFKMKNDPRITPIGKIIRRLSLDEWPQFINVFKGEMSLVGTRPPTPDEVSEYKKWHHRRMSIKPGITGLWQVSGRNAITDFNEIVKLDLKYIDSWSIWLDTMIILKTIFIIFKRESAF
ncbi:MAG: sugar transferase [Chitinivibrionales bacterium]|nr:sugar transferase [Chitinivibrionales bacterium]